MRCMITAGLTAAALAAAPGTEAANVTPQKAARIAKQVFHREIRRLAETAEPILTAEHAITADHADYASNTAHAHRADEATNATTANHATTAGSAASAQTANHATTAGRAATAETAEVAGAAEAANPMAYALVNKNGTIDAARSSGIPQPFVVNQGGGSFYCFSGPRPKVVQATVRHDDSGFNAHPTLVVGVDNFWFNGCPAGTEFYVFGRQGNGALNGPVSFFLSLVL